MRRIALPLVALLIGSLAHADSLEMKEVKYRGGIVRFQIPKHWVEEYEPDGGGVFYEDAPNTGTLRLNIITAKSPTAIGKDAAFEALRSLESVRPENIKHLSNSNAISTWVQHSAERGTAITLFWWHLANAVPPSHVRTANFSYTVLTSQESTARTTSELQALTNSIENAVFIPTLGQ